MDEEAETLKYDRFHRVVEAKLMLDPVMVPVATMLPLIDSISAGEVVPIPT